MCGTLFPRGGDVGCGPSADLIPYSVQEPDIKSQQTWYRPGSHPLRRPIPPIPSCSSHPVQAQTAPFLFPDQINVLRPFIRMSFPLG